MGMKYMGRYYTHRELVDAAETQTQTLNDHGRCDQIDLTREDYMTWSDRELLRCIVGDSNKFGVPTFLTIWDA